MRIYLIGAATVALAASAALAAPGNGHGGGGNGHGNGGGHGGGAAVSGPAKGGGQGHGQGGQGPGQGQGKQAKAGPSMHQAKVDHGPAAKGGQGHGPQRDAARAAGHGNSGKGRSNDVRPVTAKARDVREVRDVRDVRDVRVAGNGRDDRRVVRTVVNFDRNVNHGLINGCPPGLAKKNNGCQPPGLAKNRDDYRSDYYRPSWFGYSSAQDGRYRYGDGYLYRMDDRGSVLGYLPLLGGALSVGNPWPSYYQPARVPDYYVQYYNLGQPNSYRYADDVLYRVDPQTDAITSIAALLTGDQFGIGQRMPAGYDVYNVPYAYRDQYYDTPQYDYRYADGYVYQVDPTTQLIQAAIQLLT